MTSSRSYPQPYEGIAGTDRTADDLLSLGETAIPRRMMIAGLARCLRSATLVGSPAPVVARMSARIQNPQPGDLVMEESTSWSRDEDTRVKGFGILLAHRDEWWETDEERAAYVAEERADHERFLHSDYAQAGDDDEPWEPSERQVDHAWYVQYGTRAGDVCRWVNCSFIAIPIDEKSFSQPFGTQHGNGTMVTRSDLLGALADSGFQLRPGLAP